MARKPFPLEITSLKARQFLIQATELQGQFSSTVEAIRHMGYTQMDPIDVCGKMHDLILRNRVSGYRRGDLLASLYNPQPRKLFEHYIPERGILVAFPVTDYRFIARAMQRRRRREGYGGALNADQQKMARIILRRIREEGPLGASDFQNPIRSQTGWGTSGSLAKATLDKLFYHGRLLVSRREKFRRLFDLPERILPEDIVTARPATPREEARWLVLERLRQRRLVRLSTTQRELVAKEIQALRVEGGSLLYCLKEDVRLFDLPSQEAPPMLLAPLDPIVYDRTITRQVWGFDYIWEVYTPPAKRLRGYYALPLLVEGRIAGHVDPRADKASDTLKAQTNVSDESLVRTLLRQLADFLDLSKVQLEPMKEG